MIEIYQKRIIKIATLKAQSNIKKIKNRAFIVKTLYRFNSIDIGVLGQFSRDLINIFLIIITKLNSGDDLNNY